MGTERSRSIAEYLAGNSMDIRHYGERQKLEYNIKINFEKIVGRGVNNNKIYLDDVYYGINV
jgi:hypothetical protein